MYCVLLLLVIIITAVVVPNSPIAYILCKLPQTLWHNSAVLLLGDCFCSTPGCLHKLM